MFRVGSIKKWKNRWKKSSISQKIKSKKNNTAKLRQSYTFGRLAILSARGRGKRLVLANKINKGYNFVTEAFKLYIVPLKRTN